jgi:hypothetical protein
MTGVILVVVYLVTCILFYYYILIRCKRIQNEITQTRLNINQLNRKMDNLIDLYLMYIEERINEEEE